MKALSLWQPYASLIAEGWKIQETRNWPAPVSIEGTRIAIHAAKRRLYPEDFNGYFKIMLLEALGKDWWNRIPFGALVATATLERSWKVVWTDKAKGHPGLHASLPERINHNFGDFSEGRWIWQLGNVRCLPEPIPFRGARGIFNTKLPDQDFNCNLCGKVHPAYQNADDNGFCPDCYEAEGSPAPR